MNRQGAYLDEMSTLGLTTGADQTASRQQTAKAQRLAQEAEMIAAASASVAAGRTVSLEAVTAWADSWDTDHELPPPHSGR
jgi:predicted transcriptional regulator